LAEHRRSVIPRRVVAQLCRVRALNARTRVREQVRSCRNLERGGPRSREARTLERGGPRSRAARALERGGPHSRGFEPSSEADLARGGALLGRFGGPRGPPRRGSRCVYVLCSARGWVCVLHFLQVLSKIPHSFLGDPRGCPRQLEGSKIFFMSSKCFIWIVHVLIYLWEFS
jgi:hypothetical protein